MLDRGTHDGKLFDRGAHDQDLDGDIKRRDSDLDRFRPSDRHNTLRPVSLVYCIDLDDQIACLLGDPCLSLYSLEGQGYK